MRLENLIAEIEEEMYKKIAENRTVAEDEAKETAKIVGMSAIKYCLLYTSCGLAGALIPFNSEGIDFAMTALFVVIFVEQWMDRKNRIPEMIGVAASFICLQIFGMDSFVLPSMILIVLVLFIARTRLERQVDETCQ